MLQFGAKIDVISKKKKRFSLKFKRFFGSKLGDLQKKKVFRLHMLISRWAPSRALKQTAFLKPIGPLKSMSPGVIVPPCPPFGGPNSHRNTLDCLIGHTLCFLLRKLEKNSSLNYQKDNTTFHGA